MNKMAIDPNADTTYFPGQLTENGKEFYFQDQNTKIGIVGILEEKFRLPENIENCPGFSISCALALRGAFFSLVEGLERGWGDTIPIKTVLILTMCLNDLVEKTRDLRDLINKQEEIGDRNSRNSSTRTLARIDDYKKHEKYPELEQMIKSYQGTQKELRKINKLMADILGTKNKVTIRRYRHLFFQDLQK